MEKYKKMDQIQNILKNPANSILSITARKNTNNDSLRMFIIDVKKV